MKNIFYLLLLFTQVFWAQDAFEKANRLYQKDKFQEAIAEYETILNTKNHAAEVYFNLGNAYYKLNKIAPSIYNYEKALQLNPNYEDAKNNLRFAQNMTIDEIKPIERVGFGKTIENFTSKHSYDDWGKIAIGFSVAFLLFFIAYYFLSNTTLKRIFFIGMFFALLGMVASVSFAFSEKKRIENDKPAIIFAEKVVAKATPKDSAKDSFTLHEGTKVQILQVANEWLKIQLSDERIGWITKDAIKELK